MIRKPEIASAHFWIHSAERAVKTAAQSAIALIGAQMTDVLKLDWAGLLSVSAGAAVVSVLTSIASTQVGDPHSPSLVDAHTPER